ncbi:MAG TPA: hypothetical protein VFL94_11465 [Actinomycetales bacterium]|nr:hypothetical protein [Actinomycetales bacterium]
MRARTAGAALALLLTGTAAALSAAPAFAEATGSPTTSPTASATASTTPSPTAPATVTGAPTAPTSDPGTATSTGTATSAGSATADPGAGAAAEEPTRPAPATSSAPPAATPTAAPHVTALALPTGTAAEKAASYLVVQLTEGDHVVGPYGPDLGQTADVVLALSSLPAQTASRDAAAAYLAAHVDDYVHGAAYVDGTEWGEKAGANYAGPTGKAIVAALAAGLNPRALGGFDLVDELQGLMSTSGSTEGRFSDDSAYGDYSNPIGQAFDILALKRTTGDVPAPAVRYLLTAQCKDGGFADAYPASPASCTSNPDTTGLALQALVAAGVTDSGSDTACAAAKALAWLTAHDAKDGSYASGAVNPSASPTANVNSTAYAALGLTAATVGTAPQVAYLASVQNPDGGLPIVPASSDTSSNVLATAQALNALTGSSFLSLGTSPLAAAAPACALATTPTTKPTTGGGGATATTGTPPGDPRDVSAAAASLPRTGADPLVPGLAGLALLAFGGAAVALSRRPRGARAS